MRKQLMAVAALGASVLTIAGCTGAPAEPTGSADPAAGGEIGFFAVSAQIPIIQSLADQITEYFEAEGYTVVIRDAGFDPVKQAQQIQQAVDSNAIVGAWIFPAAADALGPSIEALQSAGIPAVIETSHVTAGFDGPQPGITFDEPASADFGAAIGEEATACADEEGGTEAILVEAPPMGPSVDPVHEAIVAGYTGNAPLVASTNVASDIASAQTAVSQLLIAHPDADVVIAGSDENALGAINAFKAAGKTPKCVIAGGGGPDALAAQEAGDITAVVSIDYAASVDAATADLLRLLGDPTAEGILNPTPIKVVK